MKVIDCGNGSGVLYDASTNICTRYSKGDLLKVVSQLPSGSVVVGEDAHFGRPQKDLSRAQPYTEKQLLDWYEACRNNGVILKLFPQQMTARAKNYSACTEKTDENDARAICKLLTDFPQITMKRPPKSFITSTKREEIYKFKKDTNAILNVGRGREDKYDDLEDAIVKFIRTSLQKIADDLTPEQQEIFGISRYKKGNKKKNLQAGDLNFSKVKMTILYSIAATLIDYNGNKRICLSTGEIPSWKFAKRYILGFGPFHLKGGVARSNIVFHGMRHWIGGKIKDKFELPKKVMCGRGGYFRDDDKKDYVPPFTPEIDQYFVECRKIYSEAIKAVFMKFRAELKAS